MNKCKMFFMAITGCHNIQNGTTCEISRSLWDVHDYGENTGGDGTPSHFHLYECPKCGKKFSI